LSAELPFELNGKQLLLAGRESVVLDLLVRNAPNPVSRQDLRKALAGKKEWLSSYALEVCIYRLRAKLAPLDIAVRTVRGRGYCLELPL
jgi:DNA-binding response OmpR family regulator